MMCCDLCTKKSICTKIISTKSYRPSYLSLCGTLKITRDIDISKEYYCIYTDYGARPASHKVLKVRITAKRSTDIEVKTWYGLTFSYWYGDEDGLFVTQESAQNFANYLNEQEIRYAE